MRGWKDWLGAFVVVLILVVAGSAPQSEAGPLRRLACGVGKGVAKAGRFAYRRVTFQRLRGRSSGDCGSASSGGCANGVCSQ